ncbi:MAG: glycosyltransferase [Candidatus Omnitrophota bacterium]|nr:glycosyltransferase [Candidatus Omnitrophota bacterium]
MTPMISVVIPTYNRAGMLSEAIESVLAQGYTNWELIIVDDGSADQTAEVAANVQRQYPMVRYLRQDPQGQFAALNTGTRLARGEYVALLDDDDHWLPDKLSVQLTHLQAHPEWAFVYSLMWVEDPTGLTTHTKPAVRGEDTFEALLSHNFVPMSALVRRSCLEQIGGFDGTLARAGDYDLWLRLAARYPFGSTPEPLAIFRRHGHNKTARYGAVHYACHVRIFQKLLDNPTLPAVYRISARRRLAKELYLLGRAWLEENQPTRAAQAFREAVAVNPLVGQVFVESADRQLQQMWKAVKPYLMLGYASLTALRKG